MALLYSSPSELIQSCPAHLTLSPQIPLCHAQKYLDIPQRAPRCPLAIKLPQPSMSHSCLRSPKFSTYQFYARYSSGCQGHKIHVSAIRELTFESKKHTEKFRQAAQSTLHKEVIQEGAREREGLGARQSLPSKGWDARHSIQTIGLEP